jgi:hypothetical protein
VVAEFAVQFDADGRSPHLQGDGHGGTPTYEWIEDYATPGAASCNAPTNQLPGVGGEVSATGDGVAIGLGDGALWIWNVAAEHLPGAIQVTDYFHTLQHLNHLAEAAVPADDDAAHQWLAERRAELDHGDIEALLDAAQQVDADAAQRLEINKAANYFEVNRERMRYSRFCAMGLFVGSGTVEAGCKSLVAQRLKQSGMRWRVRGGAAIIRLRCQEASNRWEELWAREIAGFNSRIHGKLITCSMMSLGSW